MRGEMKVLRIGLRDVSNENTKESIFEWFEIKN